MARQRIAHLGKIAAIQLGEAAARERNLERAEQLCTYAHIQEDQVAPIIRFTTLEGQEKLWSSNAYNLISSPLKMGQEVEVVYDSDRPERVLLNHRSEMVHYWPFRGFGTFFIIVGIGLVLSA